MSRTNKIHVRNAYGAGATTYYPVLIVGAGASGIAMACRLKAVLGFDQFRIFDRQSRMGGTWWINRYPGVACDVPTALYSFSFAPNYTSAQLFPSGKEFVEYLYRVAEDSKIMDKIQLNTEITEIRYIEEDQEWEVQILQLLPGMGDLSERDRQERGCVYASKETVRAKTVISCVGVLVEPNAWPDDISERDAYRGELIHSGRWPDDIDLQGKDIVVVGSGCSAAQIVPSLLQTDVRSVTQIMRTPPWVNPRIEEPFGKERYARYAPTVFDFFPFMGYAIRIFTYIFTEFLWLTVFQESNVKLRRMAERFSLDYMRSKAPEKYHEIMTPQYSYGCKRRVFDSAWLESMNNPKFKLTTQPLKKIEALSVTLGPSVAETSMGPKPLDEDLLPADIIVLANGFEATRFLHPLKVYGRDAVSIHDQWMERGGPQAYMGTAIDGFPNFFMVVGPNTFVGHSSVIISIESTVGYILKIIRPMLNGDAVMVEPKREATLRWTADIQQRMGKTVFAGCRSWYADQRGWNSAMYPRSQLDFALRCAFPRFSDWNTTLTRKGTFKKRARYVLGCVTLAAVIFSLFYARISNNGAFVVVIRKSLSRILGTIGDGANCLKAAIWK